MTKAPPPPSRLPYLHPETQDQIDSALREMIIAFARQQAWQDHLAAMTPAPDRP